MRRSVYSTDTVVLGLDLGLLEHLRRRTTDVERTHGQLRAGFADRLRGDDADRLAELGQHIRRERNAVALRADAATRFAGQHRADLHPLRADAVDRRRLDFVDDAARFHDRLARRPDR